MSPPPYRAFLNPHLARLEEYAPIDPFEVLSARLGIAAERIVKLDANENPYGPLRRRSRPLRAIRTSISIPTPGSRCCAMR